MLKKDHKLTRRIKELEKLIRSLKKDLIHDKLTGLKTRAFFEEEARVYFGVAASSAGPYGPRRRQWFGFSHLSFIFFDLDNFKNINDNFGHSAGDEVLRSIAEVIQASVRDGDTAARWGGEEIAVTLVGATERDAFHKAEDIRRQIENTRFGKFPELRVTISGGIASAASGSTFEDTIIRADKSLYKAKKLGKNRVVSYSEL